MSALDSPEFGLDDRTDELDQAEIFVEHNPEQTLIVCELEHGSVAAAVDVGEITIEDTVALGRDLQETFRDVTTPASGGGD